MVGPLYQLAMAAALVVVGPFILLRHGRRRAWPTLRGRWGASHPPPPGPRPLWIHAVSVGEVGVAATLARALPRDLPLVVTTVTPTGQERARALFAERAAVTYLPLDLGFSVERFFRHFQPRALVMVEGDLWPLVLARAGARGLPRLVVNGRVSDRTFRRLVRLGALAKPVLRATYGEADAFGVQTREDAERLQTLGVPAGQVTVTGNLKYESPEPPPHPALAAALATVAAGRAILVAGSTMAGEEEQVLDGFAAAGGGHRALLVLAPRHPERWDAVGQLLARRQLAWRRRSQLEGTAGPLTGAPAASAAPAPPDLGQGARADVVLLDSMGELAGLYRLAAASFVGGTLVATGGHNPLEPARFGRAVAVGPAMDNFRAMAEDFDRRGAWARVRDARELGTVWRSWLDDPAAAAAVGERAATLVRENQGSLAATVALLARFGLAP
jgi:3-deoxy-D-manno-octulosonic-acid transferase